MSIELDCEIIGSLCMQESSPVPRLAFASMESSIPRFPTDYRICAEPSIILCICPIWPLPPLLYLHCPIIMRLLDSQTRELLFIFLLYRISVFVDKVHLLVRRQRSTRHRRSCRSGSCTQCHSCSHTLRTPSRWPQSRKSCCSHKDPSDLSCSTSLWCCHISSPRVCTGSSRLVPDRALPWKKPEYQHYYTLYVSQTVPIGILTYKYYHFSLSFSIKYIHLYLLIDHILSWKSIYWHQWFSIATF